MASVTFKIFKSGNVTCSDPDNQKWNPAYKQGQIIFAKSEQKIYLDFDGDRTCYTPDVPSSSSGGMNYLGIADDIPTNSSVTLKDGSIVTAHEKDMVVVGTKEYLYRKDEHGVLGWFEVGDESAPTWET